METINTEDIPQILKPYLENKDNYSRGNFINNKIFLQIATEFIEWYNKRKHIIVENLKEAYALTGYQTGYNTLSEDWRRRRNWKQATKGKKEYYTTEVCEKIVFDNMRAAIAHLYQANHSTSKGIERKHRSGAIGLLVSSTIEVEVFYSNSIDMVDVCYNYQVKVNLTAKSHSTIQVHEEWL